MLIMVLLVLAGSTAGVEAEKSDIHLHNTTVKPGDQDRGYFLHFPAIDDRKVSIQQADVHIGRGEFEYLEIDLTPLRELGEVGLKLTPPEDFAGHAELLVDWIFICTWDPEEGRWKIC